MEQDRALPLPARLGRYRLDRGTASYGATGVVVRAEEVGDARPVAIKIPNELAPGPRARTRLEREARIAREAGSPHVVRMLHRDVDGEPPYLVMEWVPQTVSGLVTEQGRLDERLALRIMLQSAEALARLHERGIVHRDISPRNIGLTDELEVRLLDFGIAASAAESGGASTAALGTPAFSAPERLAETLHDDDPRVDLYSLGCVGFLMLTGIAPYAGTRSEVVRRHRAGERPDVAIAPARLRPMLERLLAEDPQQRYQSAAALVEDLRSLLGMSSTATQPIAGRPQRRGMGASLVPAFGLGLAAVIAILVLTRGEEPAPVLAGPEPSATQETAAIVEPEPTGALGGWGVIATRPPIPQPMRLAASATHLYVGQNGQAATDDTITVWKASFLGNGAIGPWIEQDGIQTGRSGFPASFQLSGMAIWESCLFALPGDTNSDPISDEQVIEAARIDPGTGDLSSFALAGSLTTRRAGAALVTANARLYAIGGFQFTESEDRRSVEFATIGPGCTLSDWALTAPLPIANSAPEAVTDGQSIWVIGGHPGDSGAVPLADVQRTSINPDGTLAPWQAVSQEQLSTPRFSHGVAIVGDFLVAVGGNIQAVGSDPTIYTETVEYAEIRADGSLASWEAGPPLPQPRSGHGMIAVDDELFVIGGGVGRRTPRIIPAEVGLTTNPAIGRPPAPPPDVVDTELPTIIELSCSPSLARTGDTLRCISRTTGSVQTVEWVTSTTTSEGVALEFEVWAPGTTLVSLEVCNTLGCVYADQAIFVTAGEHFWETDQIRHPESLPAAGGEFKASTVAGTQNRLEGADVVFRVVGGDVDETVVGAGCAFARQSWGVSICYDASFVIPPNLTGTRQTYTIEASAPTLEGVLTSSFAVAAE